MIITEDFAYERLYDQMEYIHEVKTRQMSEVRRKEILESAFAVYNRWRSEVRTFLNLKKHG